MGPVLDKKAIFIHIAKQGYIGVCCLYGLYGFFLLGMETLSWICKHCHLEAAAWPWGLLLTPSPVLSHHSKLWATWR